MTACERATAGLEATVMVEEVEVSQATVASSFRPQAWRAAMRQFVQDVLLGLRRVSHNTLAMLGLVAVVGVVFWPVARCASPPGAPDPGLVDRPRHEPGDGE